MRNIIRIILLLFLLIPAYSGSGQATDSARISETIPEIRYPQEESLTEFRQSEDFNYLDQATPGRSVWDRFWAWVNKIISFLFASESTTFMGALFRILLYAVVIGAMVYVIYKLVKSRYGNIISGKPDDDLLQADIKEENIHRLDFEELIRNALSASDYRLAIRLRYLQTLKLLADRQVIHWEPFKTNHEYSYEITEGRVREAFDRISYYFDYAWYGEFSVEERHYQRVGEIFDELKSPS